MSVTEMPAVVTVVRTKPVGHVVTNVVASEWTKLRSVRSTYWTLAAAAVSMIGLSALICAVIVAQYAHLTAKDRATIDPASLSLSGGILAQLAIAVLGVLVITSEYSSGMIRTTLAAVPQRLTLLAAKAWVFKLVTFVVMTAACFIAFFIGQMILSTKGLGVSIGSPDALRTVVGTSLYVTVLGLLALGIGGLIRKTAGAITAVVGMLFVLPAIASFLPSSLEAVQKFLPTNAGQAITAGSHRSGGAASLSPYVGMAVFILYATVALAAAGYTLVRRDA